MEAIHSKKPMREKYSSPKYTLAQFHKLQTKEFFNFWIFNSPPLKANLFLSFQTVQKIHNGMDFQILFLFFPTNEPLQDIKASFTVSGWTHLTSINPKIISHRALVTIQCKSIWCTFSSSNMWYLLLAFCSWNYFLALFQPWTLLKSQVHHVHKQTKPTMVLLKFDFFNDLRY